MFIFVQIGLEMHIDKYVSNTHSVLMSLEKKYICEVEQQGAVYASINNISSTPNSPSGSNKCCLHFVAIFWKEKKKSITLKHSFPSQCLEHVTRDNKLAIGKGNN